MVVALLSRGAVEALLRTLWRADGSVLPSTEQRMEDRFVSASEVAFVVHEYLRQEGFQRTVAAFRDEAAQRLSEVTTVRGYRGTNVLLDGHTRARARMKTCTRACTMRFFVVLSKC